LELSPAFFGPLAAAIFGFGVAGLPLMVPGYSYIRQTVSEIGEIGSPARIPFAVVLCTGEGELRFGEEHYAIRKHTVIACPTGGPEVAHQIINTGSTAMRYLALSNRVDMEACEYPDSGKVLIVAGNREDAGLRLMFRAESTVDYYDRARNDKHL
jgi:hypothetical protein